MPETSTMDPYNPPKHCPSCLAKGKEKKVKIYSINLDGEAVVMCEDTSCPWPINSRTLEEIICDKKKAKETMKANKENQNSSQ